MCHRAVADFSSKHDGLLTAVSCSIESQDTAAAAIFLASKVEEFRVHIKDVMMVTYKIRHKNERKLIENSDVSVDVVGALS